METKFTKGEWIIFNPEEIKKGKESIGIDSIGKTRKENKSIIIFSEENIPVSITPEESFANAKLIAAAPELLEACIYAIEVDFSSHREIQNMMLKIQNAIKKAIK